MVMCVWGFLQLTCFAFLLLADVHFLQALNLLTLCFAPSPPPLQLVMECMHLVGISTDFIIALVVAALMVPMDTCLLASLPVFHLTWHFLLSTFPKLINWQ